MESNSRGRDRVPVEITGVGELVDEGGSFDFTAVDFSVQGLMLKTASAIPRMGDKVRLNLELSNDVEEFKAVVLLGEVVRYSRQGDESLCGVNWLENENAHNLEALESFYMERFFDMIG